METTHWYKVKQENKLVTPGLLVYPERIKENIASMIKIAGGNGRLWPHIKTHKMREVVKLQMEQGITRFKCATLGEVELLISCNVTHILLAHQPTEEKAKYFLSLQASNPQIQFSTLVDNLDSLQLFSTLAAALNQELSLWIDINNGMNRTGIVPELAYSLFEAEAMVRSWCGWKMAAPRGKAPCSPRNVASVAGRFHWPISSPSSLGHSCEIMDRGSNS